MFGVRRLVLGLVVEEPALGDDADRRQRSLLQQPDGQLGAGDELLDQRLLVPGQHRLQGPAGSASSGVLQTNTSMLLPLD